jgi:predicted deacylase
VSDTFTFCGITAARGQKVWGRLKFVDGFDGAAAAVINGASPGPTAWILAGVHGDEIESMVAVQQFVRDVDPNSVSGVIVAVVSLNDTALANWERESPIDGKDLNRVFPGSADGSFTERLAHGFFNSIEPLLSSEDCIFNLHGGGRTVLCARLIELRGTGDAAEERCAKLSEAACNPNLNIIARIEERTGEWASTYRGTLLRELAGKAPAACITIEAGGLGRLDDRDILAHYDGIFNVLIELEMYRGRAKKPAGNIIKTAESTRVMPTKRGFWKRHIDIGARVREGQHLASVLDEKGNEIERLVAPFTGIVLYLRGFGLVDPLSHKLGHRYGINMGRYP